MTELKPSYWLYLQDGQTYLSEERWPEHEREGAEETPLYTSTPAPASDDAMEVFRAATAAGITEPGLLYDEQAAARIIQSYGDQREAAASCDCSWKDGEAAGFRRGVEAADFNTRQLTASQASCEYLAKEADRLLVENARIKALGDGLAATARLVRQGIRALGVKREPVLYEAVMAFDAALAAWETRDA